MQAKIFEDPGDRVGTLRPRIDEAARTIYPHLVVRAHRLVHARGVCDVEAGDLCQEGLMQALSFLYRSDQERRLDEGLDVEAVAAILFAVAVKAMHGRLVDYIRRQVFRRSREQMLPLGRDVDHSFEAGREARDILDDMMARAPESGRRVLEAVVAVGEVDISAIIERTGFSRAYVYRMLQRLAKTGQEP